MGFIDKVELKKQLQEMGVKIEGGCIKKSDLKMILTRDTVESDIPYGGMESVDWTDIAKETKKLSKIAADMEKAVAKKNFSKADDAYEALRDVVYNIQHYFTP